MPKNGVVCLKVIDSYVLTASTDGYLDITNKFNGIRWTAIPNVFIKAVEDTNGSTLDVSVEVSHNNGTDKEVCVAMTQLSASGHELKAITIPPWGEKVYINTVVSAGGGQYTLNVYVAGPAVGSPVGN